MSVTTRVYYNKLVRDNIPAIIKAKREDCGVRSITDMQEFQQELFKKIKEEATSLAMSRTKAEFLEEYADLLVVLDTITKELDISAEAVQMAKEENLLRKGGYKHQHFLQWSGDLSYQSNETPQGIPA